MRRTAIAILAGILVLGTVVLTGCGARVEKTGTGGTLVGIDWVLEDLANPPAAANGHAINPTLSFDEANGTASGKALNNYSGPYKTKAAGQLEIGPLTTTLMAGPENDMAFETAYLEALQKTAGYFSDGKTLTLFDKDGVQLMKFTQNTIGLVGTKWTVTGYNNGKDAVVSVLASTTINAEFDASGTVSGQGGVNTYNGTYTTLQPDGITIKDVATTKMAGPQEAMDQETAYLAALQSAATYSVSGNKLELRTADGKIAVTLVTP